MAVERSKPILLYDAKKAKQVNPETLRLFQKYQIDMSIRDLSEKTIRGYNSDLMQWFIYSIITNLIYLFLKQKKKILKNIISGENSKVIMLIVRNVSCLLFPLSINFFVRKNSLQNPQWNLLIDQNKDNLLLYKLI